MILRTLSLIGIATVSLSATVFAAGNDRSGDFRCACIESRHCATSDGFKVSYDSDRQWIKVEGEGWIYSGYVSRQESKVTGEVFLMLPKTYSIGTGMLVFRPDGKVTLNGSELTCSRTSP